jgi:threonine dehydrogenase-like Zn-dependent dehydrogenase
MPNPWLEIALDDYEGHMRAPGVEQLGLLSDLFAYALATCAPNSVAILGIAGGNGLDAVNPAVTPRVVGIDINSAYLEATRRRFGTIPNLELHCLDLANQQVKVEPVDLVHAGLIFEHAGTERCLENALAMVRADGTLSVVLQLSSAVERDVGTSSFPALSKLASEFSLVNPDALIARLATGSFEPMHQSIHPLAAGKAFWLGIFKRLVATPRAGQAAERS